MSKGRKAAVTNQDVFCQGVLSKNMDEATILAFFVYIGMLFFKDADSRSIKI